MSRCKRSQRGNTLPELLIVVVVLGLLMTMLAAIFAPLMRSQSRSQAKLDTVQSAAAALYRIQRDLRQTDYLSTWACTTGSSASCSQPTTFGSTTAIAFPTSYQNGTGQFQLQPNGSNVGQPNWQGIMVYWLDSSGDLHWAFDAPAGKSWPGSSSVNATVAAQAVADATTGVVTGTEIAANFQQLAVAINPVQTNIVSLKIQAQSTENGAVNETTYRSDVLARK
jgi:prepilin-type N-terminal cleavage/methylation domain-containing protein